MQLCFKLFSLAAGFPVLPYHAFIGSFCFRYLFCLLVIRPFKDFLLFSHGFCAVLIRLVFCIYFLQFCAQKG